MRALSVPRWRWPRGRASRDLPYDLGEGALIVALAVAVAALLWVLVRPLGPVGNWQAKGSTLAPADPTILTRFDPFFRAAPSGPAAVTSLPFKLFGVRVDQAMGRGSAIIAGPDGVQTSYAIGDEIQPGVTLKAVAFDGVTISRGGVDEQLFLDQSGAAAAPAAPGAPTAAPPQVVAPSPPANPRALVDGVSFSPRLEKGALTGLAVGPRGNGEVFAATGLRPGDVVTQINGASVTSVDEATAALAKNTAGSMTLTIERGGRTQTLVARVPR